MFKPIKTNKAGNNNFKPLRAKSQFAEKEISPKDFNFKSEVDNQEFYVLKNINILEKFPEKKSMFSIITTNETSRVDYFDKINDLFKIKEVNGCFVYLCSKAADIISKYDVNMILARERKNEIVDIDIIKRLNPKKIYKSIHHMKFFAIRCEDNFISIITSTNPKRSAQSEVYQIYNSEDIYLNLLKLIQNAGG